MLDYRLHSLELFHNPPFPDWGSDLSGINFDDVIYYQRYAGDKVRSWDDVPDSIKATLERFGIPEAERHYLSEAVAQYESEVVCHKMKKEFQKQGIVFTDTDTAIQKYPDLVKEYFGTLVSNAEQICGAQRSRLVWRPLYLCA